MDNDFARALSPVLMLLACGVVTILVSQVTRTSAVVGYLGLGVALKALGWLPSAGDDRDQTSRN